jgi:hypothetical protein
MLCLTLNSLFNLNFIKMFKTKKIIKKYVFPSFCVLSFYVFFCRKANDLWFENDFRKVFPEIFAPYSKRYSHTFEDGWNILQEIPKLKPNEDQNILNKRRSQNFLINEETKSQIKAKEDNKVISNISEIFDMKTNKNKI